MSKGERDQTGTSADEQELLQLREILMGKDAKHLIAALEPHSRKLVADVLVQALHDRQKSDNAVSHVIAPIVEKTVERSVANHSEQLTSILYPLVGSLVRKAVSAFLSQFIERTNDIIENALSPKGIKWRFQAWQTGVSYSQLVASQTYVYKVEQLLLIHRETGILLKSVAANPKDDSDADLVSSMLSAINDFVTDSFTQQDNDQQLGEVKTEDFTLIICHSPHALLVAAVTGNIPQQIRMQLQEVLDNIHAVHRSDLLRFKGDTLPFEVTDIVLRENLKAEVKPEHEKKKHIPWFGWIAFVALLTGMGWYLVGEWQTYMLKQKLLDLNSEPGMLVTEIESTGRNRVSATILRDRASLPIEDWLQEHDINRADLRIIEQAFISIESEIVARKLSQLVANYPSLSFIPASQEVSGILNWRQMQQFNRDFAALPGIGELSIDRSNVRLAEISLQAGDQPAIQRQLFEQLVGEISRVQIEFQVGESNLDEAAINTVVELTKLLESALEIGQSLQLSANLIIIGASDTSGATSVNQRLSLQRANAVKTALINQGIEVNRLYSTGIGEINLSSDAVATRRVMFNLMYAETKS